MRVATLPGYSRYEVLETGVVRYKITGKICPDYGDGKMVTKRGRGYRKIKIYSDEGDRHIFSVHRLVWRAFFGDIPQGFDVDHINYDRGYNHVNNLRVIPAKHNRNKKKSGKRNSKEVEFSTPSLFG